MHAAADLLGCLPEHETVRTFVALQPTASSVQCITDYMLYLQNYLPELFIDAQSTGQKTVKPLVWHAASDLHMTMAFLGMQPISLLREVWHHIQGGLLLPQQLQALVTAQLSAHTLIFLPPQKPSVLAWQLSPSDKLLSLRQELLQALQQVSVIKPLGATFLPHISLLRLPAPWRKLLSEHVPAWLQRHACQHMLGFSQLALYASRDTLSPVARKIYMQSTVSSGGDEAARYVKLGWCEISP